MYVDEDTIRLYYSNYIYRLEPPFLPLISIFRQMPPIKPLPQVPQGAPSSAPPNFIPPQPQLQQLGSDPITQGEIRPCIYRFIYMWSKTRGRFWSWLIFVGPRSVSGYRWYMNTWRYFVMDLKNIISFRCF